MKTMFVRRLGTLLCVALAACSTQDDDDLHAWMDRVRRQQPPAAAPLPAPPVIRPVVYDPSGRTDPFDMANIHAPVTAAVSGELMPDLQRPREPLEAYPLDSLRMVGSLRRQGQSVALVEADKMLHQVRKGHRLGQDQGTVVHIADSSIEIEEIIQESSGTWARRRVQLSMQGKK